MIDHEGRMADGVVPEFPTNLFFTDVITGHAKNGLPSLFGSAIGGLSFGRSRSDVAMVGEDPLKGLAANEFLVDIGMESFGKAGGVCTKGLKSAGDFGRCKRG